MSEFVYKPLPESRKMADYVAYTKQPLEAPDQSGRIGLFRSQVYVREFASVEVSAMKRTKIAATATMPATENVSVTFDMSSAGIPGLKNDFSANTKADEAAFTLLEQAHQRGRAVTLVIETVRRRKTKSDNSPISESAPIHELRGVVEKSGRLSANSNMTGENCVNIIAAVGVPGQQPILTSEVVSDPAEWADLRGNLRADRAPAGWVLTEGGIVPDNPASSPSSPVMPADAAALKQVIADAFTEMGFVPDRALLPPVTEDASAKPRAERQARYSTEGKPWDPWNSDGRVNAGGYITMRHRGVTRYAARLLIEAHRTQHLPVEAPKMANLLLWMADKVHEVVVGPVARLNRSAASFGESCRWIELVIDTFSAGDPRLAFDPSYLDSKSELAEWTNAVMRLAAELQTGALESVDEYLGGSSHGGASTGRDRQAVASVEPVQQRAVAPHQATSPASPVSPTASAAAGMPASQQSPSGQAGPVTQSGAPLDDAGRQRRTEWAGFVGQWPQKSVPEFRAVLKIAFGVEDAADVAADQWRGTLDEWKANPDRFLSMAVQVMK